MRRILMTAAALAAAVILFLLATLPPQPFRLALDGVDAAVRARTMRGAYHIHTTRSDGAEDKAAIAAAAARAGLTFAIFTDHGNGTEPRDPPAYIGGVLCLEGVEISTNGGHYIAIGLPASPYPLGGEPEAVVEDVTRLGGLGIAAHPDHPKFELAWTDWDAPIDGFEWINADAEWRDEPAAALSRTLFDYFLRPGPAVASVFDRPVKALERWNAIEKGRRVIALAAVDAHGGGRARAAEEGGAQGSAGPSYEASFRVMSNRVVLERPPTGDAATDAGLLLDGIRRGRVYSVVDAVSPDVVLGEAGVLHALPAGARVDRVAEGGSARIEIQSDRAPGDPAVPWVVANWIGPAPTPVVEPAADLGSATPLALSEWRVEKDPGSSGRVSGGGGVATLEYRLLGDPPASQFVAAAADLVEPQPMSGIAFRARSERPIRVSVQLRFPPNDARWVKSIYIGPEEQNVLVEAGRMRPAERTSGVMPGAGTARSILFVVDLVNAAAGAAGSFTVSDLRAVRSP